MAKSYRALEENRGITIIGNAAIFGACRNFWPSPSLCATAVIIGGLGIQFQHTVEASLTQTLLSK